MTDWLQDNKLKAFYIAMGSCMVLFITTHVAINVVVVVALLVLAYLGLIALKRQDRKVDDEAYADYLVQLSEEYEKKLKIWRRTRPSKIIADAYQHHPLGQLWRYMTAKEATYLGIDEATETLMLVPRDHSILVLAPTRQGKTTGVAIPQLLAHRGPAVSASSKPDVMEATSDIRFQLGNVWVFDPAGELEPSQLPEYALLVRWSPLWACRTWDDAKRTAATMIGATPVGGEGNNHNIHWTVTAEKFIAPVLFAAALHQDCTILTVRTWLNLSDFASPMAILRVIEADSGHPCRRGAGIALENLQAVFAYDERQRSGVVSTAQTTFDAYQYESVIETCTDQNFDPYAFVQSQDTVYIATSSSKQAKVAPLVAAFIDQIQEATFDLNRVDSFMSSTRHSVLLSLDEAANIAPIKALPRYISEGGSQGLQVVVFLQTLTQAVTTWPLQGRSLLDYFATRVALGGITDEATLKALSVLTGDFDREYISTSQSSTSGEQYSETLGRSRTGNRFTGQSTKSHSVTFGESYSFTWGTTSSFRKERRVSDGDIAGNMGQGRALVHSAGKWNYINIAGIYDEPWTKIISSYQSLVTTHLFGVPEMPTLVDQRLPALPDVEVLLEIERSKLDDH